jgi:hypothetical protein
MATAVVLLAASQDESSLPPAAVTALAELGVTGISVVRDDRTLGLVLEGWAFDPRRSGEAVLAALGRTRLGARTLYPLLEASVLPGASEVEYARAEEARR